MNSFLSLSMASVYLFIYSKFLIFHCSFPSCCSEVFLCSLECAHQCVAFLCFGGSCLSCTSLHKGSGFQKGLCSPRPAENSLSWPYFQMSPSRDFLCLLQKKKSPFFSVPGCKWSLAGPRQSRTVTSSIPSSPSTAHRAGVTLWNKSAESSNCFHSETKCTLISLVLAWLPSMPPALPTCLFDLAAQGECQPGMTSVRFLCIVMLLYFPRFAAWQPEAVISQGCLTRSESKIIPVWGYRVKCCCSQQ